MVSGLYTGGSGRGEAREMLDSIVLSGGIIWRGGQALGAETDWNTAANWYPSAVIPGPNDTVVIEPNFNGYYPVLDQSRTIAALNFNGGDKKVVLGNHHLTIKHNIFRADPLNYVQTFNPAPAANQPASAPLTGTLLMEVKVDSALWFPVGSSTYNPVRISNKTGQTDTFGVRVWEEVYISGTTGLRVSKPRCAQTWDISKKWPNTGQGIHLHFAWQSPQEVRYAGQPFTQLRLFHWNSLSPNWDQYNGGVLDSVFWRNAWFRTFTYANYTQSFSPFAIGTEDFPLPVDLIYIDVDCRNLAWHLSWATAAEINHQKFTLNESVDLQEWHVLAEFQGKGQGIHNQITHYSHSVPFQGNRQKYFRLDQIDIDGAVTSFPLISGTCEEPQSSGIQFYPNPTADFVRISSFSQGSNWKVFNAQEQTVQPDFHSLGTEDMLIDFRGLASGLYFIQFVENQTLKTSRLIYAP